MNIYLVVEGASTEVKVYKKWIPLVNPSLVQVYDLCDVVADNFYLISGGGYPYMFRVIEQAIEDVRLNPQFSRLVVSIDSEENTFEEKYSEIENYIQHLNPTTEYRIIVQHFCFEAWALGNRKFGPNNAKNALLKTYKTIHNVILKDPELLPDLPSEELNRAQFASKYLKLSIRDKAGHITYSKSKPDVVAHPSYFEQLKRRLEETNHIPSFQTFFDAFK